MKLYEIVFSGQLIAGAQPERVQLNLAKLFQADAQRVALLFSGRRLVLKNGLDQAAAEKYRSTLERAGAVAEVVEMAAPQGVGAMPVPEDAHQDVEEVELAPPPDEPSWTRRSQLSDTRVGLPERRAHTLRVQPRDVYMAAFVDVEAPDYGLSAPGEDVQDPKAAPVAPHLDLSGLSLAPAGADMGQAKPLEQARVPDISHLKLA